MRQDNAVKRWEARKPWSPAATTVPLNLPHTCPLNPIGCLHRRPTFEKNTGNLMHHRGGSEWPEIWMDGCVGGWMTKDHEALGYPRFQYPGQRSFGGAGQGHHWHFLLLIGVEGPGAGQAALPVRVPLEDSIFPSGSFHSDGAHQFQGFITPTRDQWGARGFFLAWLMAERPSPGWDPPAGTGFEPATQKIRTQKKCKNMQKIGSNVYLIRLLFFTNPGGPECL